MGGHVMPACETLLLRPEGAVLHVQLNRPEVRNAMSLQMVDELRQTLQAAESDGQVRVIVLRGSGGHFCAGGDIRDMAAARMKLADAAPGQDPVAEVNARFGELCVAYASTPLAVVAVLEGTVMGGGFGLAVCPTSRWPTLAPASVCRRPRWAWCRRRLPLSWSSGWATRRRGAWRSPAVAWTPLPP